MNDEEETIDYNLKCIHNVMNNFEDELCERMQSMIDEIIKYIENQQKEIEELKEIEEEHRKENGELMKIIKGLENGLRNVKKDLDFEPWSSYKVDGIILFDMSKYFEMEENKQC